MEVIAKNISIETGLSGVTLGVIQWPHGLILIDAPFHPDEVRAWRSIVLTLGGGVERLLVNLDAHLDRTLGGSAMECTIIAHQQTLEVLRNRPLTFKPQTAESGADWENKEGMINTRWAAPEITFTKEMEIHWDFSRLVLQHRPGPMNSAIWAVVPEQKVVFVGDAVIIDQPPFLAGANIPQWIDDLKQLIKPGFRDYLIVSGRSGLVPFEEIHHQIRFLEKTNNKLETLAKRNAPPQDTLKLVPKLLNEFKVPEKFIQVYEKRLSYGLYYYYLHHYGISKVEIDNKYWE
jgi:glyoxylase-like metal-dependent hydrolase (beta-lactamase superfamily II)